MMIDHQAFSRNMKLALADYSEGKAIDLDQLSLSVVALAGVGTNDLKADDQKKAFWINVYNGLTNYFIVKHELRKSVWDLPGFFSEMKVNVGGFMMSLDDIEHGVLRRNGARRNDKPRQFQEGNERLDLMVEAFDPRVHFALNCGSVSCPPLAFYSEQHIDRELAMAEASFADQEFRIDGDKREICCSELFVWYRHDFPDQYLSAPAYQGYEVVTSPYQWLIS